MKMTTPIKDFVDSYAEKAGCGPICRATRAKCLPGVKSGI